MEVLLDGAGSILAVSQMGQGKVLEDGGCRFDFTLRHIRRAATYTVTSGALTSAPTYNFDDLVAARWHVHLTTGNQLVANLVSGHDCIDRRDISLRIAQFVGDHNAHGAAEYGYSASVVGTLTNHSAQTADVTVTVTAEGPHSSNLGAYTNPIDLDVNDVSPGKTVRWAADTEALKPIEGVRARVKSAVRSTQRGCARRTVRSLWMVRAVARCSGASEKPAFSEQRRGPENDGSSPDSPAGPFGPFAAEISSVGATIGARIPNVSLCNSLLDGTFDESPHGVRHVVHPEPVEELEESHLQGELSKHLVGEA